MHIEKKIKPLCNEDKYKENRKKIERDFENESDNDIKQKKIIVRAITIAKRFFKRDKYKYNRKVLHRCENLYKDKPDRLKEICDNAIEAIPDIAREDLRIILGEAELPTFFEKEYSEKIEHLKDLLKIKMPDLRTDRGMEYLSDETKSKMFKIIKEDAQNNIELILASAIAKEYVEGMSDDTVIEALQVMEIINPIQAIRAKTRNSTNIADKDSEKLGEAWKKAAKEHMEGR